MKARILFFILLHSIVYFHISNGQSIDTISKSKSINNPDHTHDHDHDHDHQDGSDNHIHGNEINGKKLSNKHIHVHPNGYTYEHSHEHSQDHDHEYEDGNKHKHNDEYEYDHDHGHDHTHEHDHTNENNHEHEHKNDQKNGHGHDHEHDHDHKHDHKHGSKCTHHPNVEQVHQSGLSTDAKWGFSLLATLITCLTSLLGIFFLMFHKKILLKLIDTMASFAAGSLLATVIYHIYPEANEYLQDIEDQWTVRTCMIAGIIFGLIIEQGLHILLHQLGCAHSHSINETIHENCNDKHEKDNQKLKEKFCLHEHDIEAIPYDRSTVVTISKLNDHNYIESFENNNHKTFKEKIVLRFYSIKPMAWIVAAGDFFHAFVDGVLIAASFQSCNTAIGWMVTFSICLHEVPHRIGDFFIFLKAGMTVKESLLLNFFSSLSAVLGVIALLSIKNIKDHSLGYMLAFGSGTLLFISLSELIPSMMHVVHLKKAIINLFVLFGSIAIVAYVTTKYHFHCDINTGKSHSH